MNRIDGFVRLIDLQLDGGLGGFYRLPSLAHRVLESSKIAPGLGFEIELDILCSATLGFTENDVEILNSENVPKFVGLIGDEEYGENVARSDEYETPKNARDHIS